ncbi:MAG: hypothetical protein MJE68_30405 [Proteobacteria bacterium]|nr:hypothetical protein [Pseudomonadota bacterium]
MAVGVGEAADGRGRANLRHTHAKPSTPQGQNQQRKSKNRVHPLWQAGVGGKGVVGADRRP